MNVDIIGKIIFSCEMTVVINERRHYWKDNFSCEMTVIVDERRHYWKGNFLL